MYIIEKVLLTRRMSLMSSIISISLSMCTTHGRRESSQGNKCKHDRYIHRKVTPRGRIYAVYHIDERNGRYTAWRRRTSNTDSVSIPCEIRTVHADSVACTMLALCLHGYNIRYRSVLSACATRTQYRGGETPPHGPGRPV